MLKEMVAKCNEDLEKKTAEYEDARKRFSQVKEALTVERNLRARAEIKEEQMRQEIIATTGQMHAMRDKFVGDIEVRLRGVRRRKTRRNQKRGQKGRPWGVKLGRLNAQEKCGFSARHAARHAARVPPSKKLFACCCCCWGPITIVLKLFR